MNQGTAACCAAAQFDNLAIRRRCMNEGHVTVRRYGFKDVKVPACALPHKEHEKLI